MYVSQEIATALYTILKTLLLILLTQIICCICAWINRYDLAKIFEQGNVTVLIGLITTKNYSKYKSLIIYLLFALSFQIVINFLPNIANHFMPFKDVIINDGKLKYFNADFNIPLQSVPLSSSNDTMNVYCQAMNLCDTNSNYYNNIANISKTMNIIPIVPKRISSTFSEASNGFNFSTEFCDIIINNADYYIPNKISNINLINDATFSLAELISDMSSLNVIYKNNYIFTLHYDQQIIPSIFTSESMSYASIINRADILYSNGKNNVVLTMKIAVYNNYNYTFISSTYDNIFNNTQLFNNTSKQHSNSSRLIMLSQYTYNDSLIMDYFWIVNRSYTSIMKVRMSISLYVITDEVLNNIDNIFNNNFMTLSIYNKSSYSFDNINTNIFDNFNNSPTNDLFMYAILSQLNGLLYGMQGYQDIVADISPIFIGIIVSIIVLLIIVYILSRIIKDKQYFNTLLENIGINNLPKIEKEDDILLNNLEDEKII